MQFPRVVRARNDRKSRDVRAGEGERCSNAGCWLGDGLEQVRETKIHEGIINRESGILPKVSVLWLALRDS